MVKYCFDGDTFSSFEVVYFFGNMFKEYSRVPIILFLKYVADYLAVEFNLFSFNVSVSVLIFLPCPK